MEVGDVVYLKSGGRGMTVIEMPTPGDNKIQMVNLQWDSGSSLQGGSLPEMSLTLKNPAASLAVKDAATAAEVNAAEALKG